jgi:DME family drug/metabolite transporter
MTRFNHGYLFILGAAMLFGTTGTARAFAPEGMSPAFTGALRLAIGGPVLLALTAAGNRPHLDEYRTPFGKTLLAVAGVCLFQICFFSAVLRTGVAVGTLVAIGSAPLVAGLIEAVFFHEKLTLHWLAAALLSIGGVGLLIAPGNELTIERTGVLLAVGSGIGYAVYQVTCKRLVGRHSPDRVMAVILCAGALAMTPCLTGPELHLLASPRGLATALFLGIFATAAAYALFARGLMLVPVSRAAVLSLVEPLTASLLGVFILGEHLPGRAWIGMALIIGGLVLVTREGSRSARNKIAA